MSAELKDTLKLAGPIVLAQVGHMSMGLVDTLIAGRISTQALAGLGLAANFFWCGNADVGHWESPSCEDTIASRTHGPAASSRAIGGGIAIA